MAAKARETQHRNIYLTGELLSRLACAGDKIAQTARKLETIKRGSKWPDWVNKALATTKLGGKYIAAGARTGWPA